MFTNGRLNERMRKNKKNIIAKGIKIGVAKRSKRIT